MIVFQGFINPFEFLLYDYFIILLYILLIESHLRDHYYLFIIKIIHTYHEILGIKQHTFIVEGVV